MSRDPRVDDHIARQAPFAQPILHHLREAMHRACEVDEAIKWGRPFFVRDGKLVAMMAAFKAHAVFGTWRAPGSELDPDRPEWSRLAALDDLPDLATLADQISEAVAAAANAPPAKRPREPAREEVIPDDFAAALAERPSARRAFDGFPRSARADYLDWFAEAKRPETRRKRIAEATAWLAEGKRRNWRYERC